MQAAPATQPTPSKRPKADEPEKSQPSAKRRKRQDSSNSDSSSSSSSSESDGDDKPVNGHGTMSAESFRAEAERLAVELKEKGTHTYCYFNSLLSQWADIMGY